MHTMHSDKFMMFSGAQWQIWDILRVHIRCITVKFVRIDLYGIVSCTRGLQRSKKYIYCEYTLKVMLESDLHFHMHCHSVMQNVPFSTQWSFEKASRWISNRRKSEVNQKLLENVLSLNPSSLALKFGFFSDGISSFQQIDLTRHDLSWVQLLFFWSSITTWADFSGVEK